MTEDWSVVAERRFSDVVFQVVCNDWECWLVEDRGPSQLYSSWGEAPVIDTSRPRPSQGSPRPGETILLMHYTEGDYQGLNYFELRCTESTCELHAWSFGSYAGELRPARD